MEARLENMTAEKDLIKNSEQRLSLELESLRRERHTQTMLMANLQTIQVRSHLVCIHVSFFGTPLGMYTQA